jgi:hypothetical protein
MYTMEKRILTLTAEEVTADSFQCIYSVHCNLREILSQLQTKKAANAAL